MYKQISCRSFRSLLPLMGELEGQSVTCSKMENNLKKWQSVTFHFASDILSDCPLRYNCYLSLHLGVLTQFFLPLVPNSKHLQSSLFQETFSKISNRALNLNLAKLKLWL